MRTFDTGATRDTDLTKPAYNRLNCPLVEQRYGEYMTKHRLQKDGTLRSPDNWKKGIPKDSYMDSLGRHYQDVWMLFEGYTGREADIQEALCGVIFNAKGMLHEILKEKICETK